MLPLVYLHEALNQWGSTQIEQKIQTLVQYKQISLFFFLPSLCSFKFLPKCENSEIMR